MSAAILDAVRADGLEIGLTDGGDIWVKPKSRLTEATRQTLKAHKPELVDYLRRQAANDTAASPTAPVVDWREADRAYQAHHWSCPQCQASGKGHGSLCSEGQRLHAAYEAAPMPEWKAKPRSTAMPTAAPEPHPYRMTPRSEPEIVRMVELHRRAIHAGLPNNSATGKVIDELMDAPDMGSCFACNHLRGTEPERWRCAGRGHDLAGSRLPRELVVHLHRCDGYQSPPC